MASNEGLMLDYGVSLLTFENEPSVRGDVLGTSWPLNVEGVEAEVRLPRYNIDATTTRDHWPTSPDVPDADKVSKWLEHSDGHVQWGSRHSYHPDKDASAAVATIKHALVVVQFPDDVVDNDARLAVKDRAAAAAEDWCKRVVAWLSVRKALRVDPGYTGIRIVGQPEYAKGMWLHQSSESASGWDWLHSKEQVITVQMSPGGPDYMMFAATPDDWAQAAQAASSGADIPSHWQLLNSAFVACLDDNFRIAVLDAATALDLVLADVARTERLKTHSPEDTAAWLDTQTLGRKVGFLAGKVELPPAMQSVVVDLRNDVAHRNHEANRNETAEALRIARHVLTKHSSFPVL